MPCRSIFRSRESLSPRHVPTSLPHRQVYMKMLRDLFKGFLERPEEVYQKVVQIYGPTGSGKSCTILRFGLEFEGEAKAKGIPLRFIHINCKLGVDSAYALYQAILQKAAPEIAGRGYSPSEMLRQIIFHMRNAGEYMLLTLDDVDYFIRTLKEKREESGVIFDLTRLNEMHLGEYQQVVGVIFIAKDVSFRKLLDPSEVSTLGNVAIRLPGYTPEQLADILMERVDEAFRPGTVGEEIVEFVADLAASKSYNPGDCRFALDILLTSGLIADAELADHITLDHVRKAASESFDGISSEDLTSLDTHAMLILLATAEALGFHKKPYVSVKEIQEYYEIESEERRIKPVSYDKIKEYVDDLHCRGLINLNSRKGVSIVGASVKDLSRVIPTIQRGEQFEGYR
jgi:cell division control protein 6